MNKDEAEKIWVFLNRMQARNEATNTLLQAVLVLVKDDPRFALILKTVLDARMADRLNRPGINDDFMNQYLESVRSMTPENLHPLLY